MSIYSQRQLEKQATMQTQSTNSKNLRKDGKELSMENCLTVTAKFKYLLYCTNFESGNKIKNVVKKI